MIDLHCHVLPGIDDGPETIEDSLRLARAARAAGIETLVATPHVNARYPNDADTIASGVREVNERLREEGIDISVVAGAEIALTHVAEIDPQEIPRLTLGGGEWLLMEPPFAMVAPGLERLIFDLRRRGFKIVLAHPERCPVFHRDRRMLESLLGAGVLSSITAGSLVGHFGTEVRRYALEMARDGLVHNVTSDAHDCGNRAPGLLKELNQTGLGELAGWLTQAVPAAILSGTDVPERPAVAVSVESPKRRWRLRH